MARLVAALLLELVIVVTASPVYAAPASIGDLEIIIRNIIKLLTPAAAIAFLIMVIIGAFRYITSGGDQKAAAGARSTLTYAMIGVILVASAVLILRVISELTGSDVTRVDIKGGITPGGTSPAICAYDFNKDKVISSADVGVIALHMGEHNPTYDVNKDGVVTAGDQLLLAKSTGTACP